VTAPVVAVLGVKPVVPALNVETPELAGACETHAEPLEVSTFPEVPGDVIPVPPLPTGSVPVTPVESGNPVQEVRVPEDGVPNAGVTSVGEVDSTLLPEPVEVVTPVPPASTGITSVDWISSTVVPFSTRGYLFAISVPN
jgi:hypothetical protein